MVSAHEYQGCCQIVVMSLDEFLVVFPSNFAVALVGFSPMALLVGRQAGLVFASRKFKQFSCQRQKNSLIRLFFIAPFPILILLPLFFGALTEFKGQIQTYGQKMRRMKRA